MPQFCLIKKAALPYGLSPILNIQDFDHDGMVDLLAYHPGQNNIYIFYNSLESNSNKDKSLCKEESEVRESAQAIFPGLTTTYKRSVMPNPIPDFKSFKTLLKSVPSRLRIGDLDSNGYPDIIG